MAFCTEQEIRDQNDKLSSTTDVTNDDLSKAIQAAERIVKGDLSKLMQPAEVEAIGADSEVIRSLTISKATEKALVKKFGAKRKAEDVSDIQYFQNEYKKLLEDIKAGDVVIDVPETSGGEAVTKTKRYPKLSGATRNSSFYPRKGIPGFFEDGVEDDYVDDTE